MVVVQDCQELVSYTSLGIQVWYSANAMPIRFISVQILRSIKQPWCSCTVILMVMRRMVHAFYHVIVL